MANNIGIQDFANHLRDLGEAMKILAGDGQSIATVRFDPNDPSSIEAAIANVEAAIDKKVGRYSNTPMVATVVADLKGMYRQGILDRAAKGRLAEGEGSEGGE